MNDYEQRIKVLEEKVKILEETLETLKNMQMSEQMQGYIKAKTRTLKMAELINSISDKPELDMSKEQNAVKELQDAKDRIDKHISNSLKNCGVFSNLHLNNPYEFRYEVENAKDSWNNIIPELVPYIGTGIRITEYIGFESERVIIPKTINGIPVISIGEMAFCESKFSEIILPDSVVAIMDHAFDECENLSHIDLPNGLLYIGEMAFSGSGLKNISFPDYLREISVACCSCCLNLNSVRIGKKTEKIDLCAFEATNINRIVIPESVKYISGQAFSPNIIGSQPVVECAFLGDKTDIECEEQFRNVKMIYCLPGSAIQKYAREYNIPMKPLSEINLEE